MGTRAITLRAHSAIAFLCSCHARHTMSRQFHLHNRVQHQFVSLTFVFRSTHSSQLSVGLLRFCFFLGGWSCPCTAPSGLVERWASSMMQGREHRTKRQAVGQLSVLRRCDATLPGWCGCCASGNKGKDDVQDSIPRAPRKTTRGWPEDILGAPPVLERVFLSSP